MADDDRDPITIKVCESLDRRFAKVDFSTDNSPRDPDGSIPIKGLVSFGTRRQSGKDGRYYQIGIKFASLDIEASHCIFMPNLDLEDRILDGDVKESTSTSSALGGSASLEAKPGITTTVISALGLKANRETTKTSHHQYAKYRTRWVASAWEFGHPRNGDVYADDGVLKGYFLNGTWGNLEPVRGAKYYGAKIHLVIPKGTLSVPPEEWSIRPGEDHQISAFDALKSAVASWAVESQLHAAAHKNGYDGGRDELILAHGAIAVDLECMISNTQSQDLRFGLGAPPSLGLELDQTKVKPIGIDGDSCSSEAKYEEK